MASAHLHRLTGHSDRTLGRLALFPTRRSTDEAHPPVGLVTMELPWVDRDRDGRSDVSVSRLEPGAYKVIPHHSRRFPRTFRLLGTGHRSAILLHAGNVPAHTRGCILVGRSFSDFTGAAGSPDGLPDLASCRAAMDVMRGAFGLHAWTLTISDPAPSPDAALLEALDAIGRRAAPPSPSPLS